MKDPGLGYNTSKTGRVKFLVLEISAFK